MVYRNIYNTFISSESQNVNFDGTTGTRKSLQLCSMRLADWLQHARDTLMNLIGQIIWECVTAICCDVFIWRYFYRQALEVLQWQSWIVSKFTDILWLSILNWTLESTTMNIASNQGWKYDELEIFKQNPDNNNIDNNQEWWRRWW